MNENFFVEVTPGFEFADGFESGVTFFNEPTRRGATVDSSFDSSFSVPNGSEIDIDGAIFADGFESGDTSAWSETLSFELTGGAANPAATFSIVPEPTSLALGGLGLARRRRG